MVFGIVDSERPDKLVLVKADSKEKVEARLKLRDTERIIGNFTSAEISSLDSSKFTVVSG